jgi:hyaluronan synthase
MARIDPRSEITLLVDSDTVWTEKTLVELLKPFACDENVGGVTTRQKILDPNRKLVTMFANLLEEIRAEGTMKAMSVTGKVGCLPGRTIAFRTKILLDCMDEFMNETFMGFHKEVSDDRALTNLTLKMGYKTVMQDTSVVYTDAPTEWKKFVRQQLRWAEGSQYNNLKMTPWMFKNAKLMCFIYWSDMIMPMMLISVYVNTFVCQILNHVGFAIPTLNYTDAWWQIILFIILGCILSFGARNINVMRQLKWYYTLMIPVFIAVLTVVMVPVRLLGLMRCSDDLGWGTRKLKEDPQEIQQVTDKQPDSSTNNQQKPALAHSKAE